MPKKGAEVVPIKQEEIAEVEPEQATDEEETTDEEQEFDLETVPLDDKDDRVSAVVYGPQGTGKTTMACKVLLAQSAGDLLIINVEGGLKKVALLQHNIPVERIRLWPKPGERPNFDDLENLLFKIQTELEDDPKALCGIVIDSGTETLKIFLDDVLEEGLASQRELTAKAKKAGTKLPPRRGGSRLRFRTERDDYGVISQQFRTLIRRLKYLGVHIVITALERSDERKGQDPMRGPAVNPAIRDDLLGYADLVLHTEIIDGDDGQPIFTARTHPTETSYGKDRYGLLPRVLVNPGMDRVIAYLEGDLLESDDPDQLAINPPQEETEPISDPVPLEEKPKPKATGKRTTATKPRASGKKVTTDDDDPPF